MSGLKYTLIKSEEQYYEYCRKLEALDDLEKKSESVEDEIDLLTLIIEAYDEEHFPLPDVDPVQLLKIFMKDHKIKANELAKFLNVSKGYVSDILNYNKGFSKTIIRKLAERFAQQQEAFNRPYRLNKSKKTIKKAKLVVKPKIKHRKAA